MKSIITSLLLTIVSTMLTYAQSIYDFSVVNDEGKCTPLANYKGRVLLIVNTATHCGYTPQYKELQALYEKYHDDGLEILDFPCNQFGAQAPGTIGEIKAFCSGKFGITFPQFEKIDVNGANADPLYQWLKAQPGAEGDIKWNFTKFLVSRDGRVIKRFASADKPEDIAPFVCQELNPVVSNIMARRSIRKYKDQPVEHEKLQAIALCGINAPSARNTQEWAVRVVEDQTLIAPVRDMLRGAANIICVCAPESKSFDLDAGLLGQNMMLAAQSMGLGTCIMTGPVKFLTTDEKARPLINRLNIPTGYRLLYVIAIGYPDESPAAKPRDEKKIEYIK